MNTPPFHRLRLRHVQVLVAVARLGSLRGAAEALAVSQPAITKTLDELEDLLGARLVERSRRGATLTPEGEVFVRHGAQGLEALAMAMQRVQGPDGVDVLRVGALPTMASALLPSALQALWAARPQTSVQVITGPNPALLSRLAQRELDVVVGRFAEPAQMEGMTYEHLATESLQAVVRPGHPLLGASVGAAAWRRSEWIVPSAGTAIRLQADNVLRAHGVEISPRLETLDVSLARQLVLGSDMVWITSASVVRLALQQGALWAVPWWTDVSAEPVGVLMRQDSPPSAAMRAFLAALKALIAPSAPRAQV